MADRSTHTMVMGVTLASGVVMGGLGLGLTETYGHKVTDGSVAKAADSDRLVGTYAAALMAMSLVTLIMGFFSGYSTIMRWVKDASQGKIWHMLHVGMSLTLAVLLATASLNIYVLETFDSLDNIEFEPATPETDQKLRGPMGLALLSMSAISVGVSALALAPTLWYGLDAAGLKKMLSMKVSGGVQQPGGDYLGSLGQMDPLASLGGYDGL